MPVLSADFKFRTCLYAHCPYKKQVNVFRSTPEKWDILYARKKPTRTADLDYFYGQSSELFSFYRIPKLLFQDSRFQPLSTDAKTLYGILLDRMSLSARNGWLDKAGRVFIIYTVQEVQDSLAVPIKRPPSCCENLKSTA